MYALMTFGIRRECIPIDEDGNVSTDEWHRRLDDFERQERKEEDERVRNNLQDGIISSPLISDVLLGRGKPYHEFPGNLEFMRLVESYRDSYVSADRLEKTALSNHVLDYLKKSGTRFLKRSGDDLSWVEVDDKAAREKISHAFRAPPKRRVVASIDAESEEVVDKKNTENEDGTTRTASESSKKRNPKRVKKN